MQGSPGGAGRRERGRRRQGQEGEQEEKIFTRSFVSYIRRKLDYHVPYLIKTHFTRLLMRYFKCPNGR